MSSQGLPVDDHDDVDEGGHDSDLLEEPAIAVLVGQVESSRGGSRPTDSWKGIETILAQVSGESDGDGTTPPEVHSLKGRKRKGERVKFPSRVDDAPWTKIERPSKQHGVLESPWGAGTEGDTHGIEAGCILPFLHQLHSTTSEGDPESANGSPTQEREVWTCGQNSYGELGHSDTRTRKVHCFVKPFEGREVVDIAAGICYADCKVV